MPRLLSNLQRPGVNTDPYPGRYVPVQTSPPTDTPGPTAARTGFRASSESASQPALSKLNGKSRARQGAGPQAQAGGVESSRATGAR